MVFVIDTNKNPCLAVHPAEARILLKTGKAAVFKRMPFTIILKEPRPPTEKRYRIKIDYGSRHTGLALLDGNNVMWLGQIEHRTNVRELLDKRRGCRRRRRSANLRYRQPRFLNRATPKGWLAPSLMSRVGNIETWVKRLCAISPVSDISYENVKFDTQLLQNKDIEGVQYQQGELWGYEVREYLLERRGRKCAYCGKENVPLEIEHIVPKSRGGSNRVSNLTLACHKCNKAKGNMTAEEYGHPEVQKQVQKPLRDAAIVTATRWKVYNVLQKTGLHVECGTGGRTKYNRVKLGLPKEHYYDACCVGVSTPDNLFMKTDDVLIIKAKGRGKHCRTLVNASGFPRGHMVRQKQFFGFTSGDFCKANVLSEKKIVVYKGRVACRKTGKFVICTEQGRIDGINHKWFVALQKSDGYEYIAERRSAAYFPRLRSEASAAQ